MGIAKILAASWHQVKLLRNMVVDQILYAGVCARCDRVLWKTGLVGIHLTHCYGGLWLNRRRSGKALTPEHIIINRITTRNDCAWNKARHAVVLLLL